MTELRVYTTTALEGIPSQLYIGLLVIFCVGAGLLLWRNGLREGLRNSALLLLTEWVVIVLAIAVSCRETGAEPRINLIPLSSYFDIAENSYLKEVAVINILNVALFIPVGLLAGCGFRGMTWRRALVIGVTLSVVIELLQLMFRKGLCETDDVIHNVVGCMIGYGVTRLFSLTRMGTRSASRKVTLA